MFVDRVRIHVQAGNGGAGVTSFYRRKGRPRGKATGGSGGRGGDIVVTASPEAATLLPYARQQHWKGGCGSHGEGDLRYGKRGSDLVLTVPLGTIVRDDKGTMLADLVSPGRQVVVACGGKGGKGNAAFVSRRRRAPTLAEQGEYGEKAWITLEVKLVADAALIGFPNAGKSTLISRVSAAKPKIADYPFTTLAPNLGVVSLGDREFVLADIPGLTEGAASGKGLGHKFLRHVERAHVLVFLIDPTPLQDRTYSEQLRLLESELRQYSSELAERPRIVVISKIDALADVEECLVWAKKHGIDVYPVSSVTGEGLTRLMHKIADEVDRYVRKAPDRASYLLYRPLDQGFDVDKEEEGWVVSGRIPERAINLSDLTIPEAADLVAARLGRIGVDSALQQAGAKRGDDVRIGDLVFTYEPDEMKDNEELG